MKKKHNKRRNSVCKLKSYKGYDKVIRSMLSEEINLQHKSLGWINTIQAFLFTGFFSGHTNGHEMVFCFVGLICSFISLCTYVTSETKIRRIHYFWDGYCKKIGRTYFDFPPVSGLPEEDKSVPKEYIKSFGIFRVHPLRAICRHFIHQKTIHIVFAALWLLLLVDMKAS